MRSYRFPLALGLSAAVVAAAAFGVSARADDDIDVNVSKGQVTLTAKGDWHINAEYPWNLVVLGTKLDKSKFTLSEKTATVTGAPQGTGTLRGGICASGKCRSFTKDVVVP
jgi:hypothetical protein